MAPEHGEQQAAPQVASLGRAPARSTIDAGGPLTAARLLTLQRQAGNAAVARLLQRAREGAGRPGSRPNLELGDSGPGVSLLQRLLGIRITGYFDKPTEKAVMAFQDNHDPPSLQPASGGVGPKTWAALDQVAERSGSAAGEPGSRPNLDVGDVGAGVLLLQRLLGVATTGVFDEPTRKAVVAFQTNHDPPSLHPATGGVGPKTWKALDDVAETSGAPVGEPGRRPNLDMGDVGPGVSLLQRLLAVPQTGVFDDATRKAVIAFQAARPALQPATGGVGPMTWKALDDGCLHGELKVGDTVIGQGTISLAPAGAIVEGSRVIARGPATLNGSLLGGGAMMVVYEGGRTVARVASAARTAATAAADVASTNAEAIELAQRAQVEMVKRAATGAVPTATAPTATGATIGVGAVATVGVAVIGFSIGVGIALSPIAVAHAGAVADRLGDLGGASLPGGVPDTPASDPGDAGVVYAPGDDAGAPAQMPGAAHDGPAEAPGTSNQRLELSGVRIPLKPSRRDRLERADEADKWTDLSGRDRTSLGKAYNHIIQTIVRGIAERGWAGTVLHYPEVTQALIDELAKKRGRVIITEGRLPGGGRFDIAEINFDQGTVELIDLTAMQSGPHAGKTGEYRAELRRLTGFPVSAYEARYVDDDAKLAEEIVFNALP